MEQLTTRNKSRIALAVTLLVPAIIMLVFGIYVTIGDGVYAGLILKGMFAPPNEKFYTVTNGSNRFLLKPLIWAYKHWPHIHWFDLTQIIPGIGVLFSLLALILYTVKKYLPATRPLLVATFITVPLGIIFTENLVLYDPLSSTLMLPFLVMVLTHVVKGKLNKLLLSAFLIVVLVFAWQIRYHGILVGFVASSALLFLGSKSIMEFVRQRWLSVVILLISFILFYKGAEYQDQQLNEEDLKIEKLDRYVYTLADAQVVNKENLDLHDPKDSISFIAYYSFYFPENVDKSLEYLDRISYETSVDKGTLDNLPMKWDTFWEESHLYTDFDTYHNFDRFMYYMLLANVVYLAFFLMMPVDRKWLWRAILWSLFTWAFFIGIGVVVKMIYKLATPLAFFFIMSFVWSIIMTIRREKITRINESWLVLAAAGLLFIGISQLGIYSNISHERTAGLNKKAEIIAEMNQLFEDKLLIFDLFSMPVMEEPIGKSSKHRQLKPKATMFGDFYMSHFPKNRMHLEDLAGSADMVPFYSHWADNPDDMIMVMSQYRIDLIKGYLTQVKGLDITIEPLPGDFKIEELEYSFYEVPLKLNYYKIHWTDSPKTDIL